MKLTLLDALLGATCWHVSAGGEPIEDRGDGAAVDDVLVMAPPVAEHVRDAVASVALRLDDGGVEAEPDATMRADRGVDAARGIDREAAHAAPKRVIGRGLDDQVEMVVLQGEVDDAKRAATEAIVAIASKHLDEHAVDRVAAEGVDVALAPHRDVDGHRVREWFARAVRGVEAVLHSLAAGPRSLAAVGEFLGFVPHLDRGNNTPI